MLLDMQDVLMYLLYPTRMYHNVIHPSRIYPSRLGSVTLIEYNLRHPPLRCRKMNDETQHVGGLRYGRPVYPNVDLLV